MDVWKRKATRNTNYGNIPAHGAYQIVNDSDYLEDEPQATLRRKKKATSHAMWCADLESNG